MLAILVFLWGYGLSSRGDFDVPHSQLGISEHGADNRVETSREHVVRRIPLLREADVVPFERFRSRHLDEGAEVEHRGVRKHNRVTVPAEGLLDQRAVQGGDRGSAALTEDADDSARGRNVVHVLVRATSD